jgi:hypothetical protein
MNNIFKLRKINKKLENFISAFYGFSIKEANLNILKLHEKKLEEAGT